MGRNRSAAAGGGHDGGAGEQNKSNTAESTADALALAHFRCRRVEYEAATLRRKAAQFGARELAHVARDLKRIVGELAALRRGGGS